MYCLPVAATAFIKVIFFIPEDMYPTQKAMKGYAASLGLTFKQVQGWFMEKRKRHKKSGEVPFNSSVQDRAESTDSLPSTCGHLASTNAKRWKKTICLQDMLFSPDYILKKVFRKDGPVLGVEFDSLPTGAFLHGKAGQYVGEYSVHFFFLRSLSNVNSFLGFIYWMRYNFYLSCFLGISLLIILLSCCLFFHTNHLGAAFALIVLLGRESEQCKA